MIRVRARPSYSPASDTGLFYSEAAVRYHYYRLISDPAKDWGHVLSTLRSDGRLQHPEGVRPAQEFALGMELFYGLLRRWLGPSVPAHVFLLDAVAVYTGLSMLLVFLLARQVTRRDGWGLLAALIYASLGPSYMRTVHIGFTPEDFALPFILATALLIGTAGTTYSRRWAVAKGVFAGVAAGMACALWHASQYFVAVTVIAASLLSLAQRPRGRARTDFALAALVAFCAVALLTPMLRAKALVLAVPGIAMLHWVLWSLPLPLHRRSKALRLIAWGGSLAALMVLFSALRGHDESYSHVTEHVMARLRHLGVPPADPDKLTFAARMYWEGDFLSPGLRQLVSQWRLGLLLVPLCGLAVLRQGWGKIALLALGLQAAVFFCWGLLMQRFMVQAGPFMSVAGIGALAALAQDARLSFRLRRKDAKSAGVGILTFAGGAVLLNVLLMPCALDESAPSDVRLLSELVQSVQGNTGKDDAFFARLPLAAVVFTYADRPVVVHPMWESASSRRKYEDILQSFYSDEETFWRKLRASQASYVLLDLMFLQGSGPGTVRYSAGRRGPAVPSWPVTRCQFAPEELHYLDLVWQNRNLRIFRVLDRRAPSDAARRQRIRRVVDEAFNPLFDSRNFEKEERGYVCEPNTYRRISRSMTLVSQAVAAARRNEFGLYGRLLDESLRLCPNNFDAHFHMVMRQLAAGRLAEARKHVAEVRRIAPMSRFVPVAQQQVATAERNAHPGTGLVP